MTFDVKETLISCRKNTKNTRFLQKLEWRDGPQLGVAVLTSWHNSFVVQPSQSGDLALWVSVCNKTTNVCYLMTMTTLYNKNKRVIWRNNSLLMMRCLLGSVTLQTIMVVSREPLATIAESGDQATVLTRAVWNPHSLLWAC